MGLMQEELPCPYPDTFSLVLRKMRVHEILGSEHGAGGQHTSHPTLMPHHVYLTKDYSLTSTPSTPNKCYF